MSESVDRGICPVCGALWCALLLANGAEVAEWRALHDAALEERSR